MKRYNLRPRKTPTKSSTAKRTARGSTVPKGLKPPLSDRSTTARMQRAHDRGLDRRHRTITVPRRQKFSARMEKVQQAFSKSKSTAQIETPFGPVTVSKFPTKDPGPKITTRQKMYSGAKTGHRYEDLSPVLFPPKKTKKRKMENDAQISEELLFTIENDKRPPKKQRKIRTEEQRNAAAKMLGISTVSEPLRVPGSSKNFRAVLRRIKAKKVTPSQAFESDTPLFSMAKSPTYQRRLTNRKFKKLRKKTKKPTGFDSLKDGFSDSSDDEY